MGFSPNKQVSLVWLAALGVVFGDIGTSPLYAYQTAVNLTGAAQAVPVASLIIWTVILVVSVKYAFILMREDFKGQGGVFALFALHKAACSPRPVGFGIIAVVVFGAALLLADEPTGALDSKSTADLLDLFDQINAAGRTVVVITHELDVAHRAKRIIRMRDGKIVGDELNKERVA